MQFKFELKEEDMKRRAFFIAVIIIFTCPAFINTAESNQTDKKECIYRSAIEKKIADCKGKLYLLDSEYKILSEIAVDALCQIKYLNEMKNRIIENMITENIPLRTRCINEYIGRDLIENQGLVESYASSI